MQRASVAVGLLLVFAGPAQATLWFTDLGESPRLLRQLRVTPDKFRPGHSTRVTFSVNRAGPVSFEVTGPGPCACKRVEFSRFAVAGKNGFRFGWSLEPGGYLLWAAPGKWTGPFVDVSDIKNARTAPFRVLKPSR